MSTAPFLPWLGLFETLRVEKGRPLFIEEHWSTLQASAQELGLSLPFDFRERAGALPPETTGRWRWVLSNEEAMDRFQPEIDLSPSTYALALAPQRVGSANWDARHKTLSYLTHWQARQSVAATDQAQEALLLNERGEIASGAMTNLFWVTGGQLHTPALECGCRNGVVRSRILRQHQVTAGAYSLESLTEAEELFVTNSWIGIRPVTRFGQRNLAIGPVTSDLQRHYWTDLALHAT